MPKGVYQRREPSQPSSPRKTVLRCKCGWNWKRTTNRSMQSCPRCGNLIDTRLRRATGSLESLKAWHAAHPKAATMAGRRLRLRVLLLVGKGQMQCTKCGCNKPGLLEINHINGGGSKEYHAAGGSGGMYRAIANLERSTEDLELLCKVCNARHYL